VTSIKGSDICIQCEIKPATPLTEIKCFVASIPVMYSLLWTWTLKEKITIRVPNKNPSTRAQIALLKIEFSSILNSMDTHNAVNTGAHSASKRSGVLPCYVSL